MLLKAEQVGDLKRLHSIAPVIAPVETGEGLAAARDLARPGYVALFAFGSLDYAADLALL